MKILQKITVVAFALLSAGAANAQTNPCSNCAPPDRPSAPTPVDPGCGTCGLAANSYFSVSQAEALRVSTANISNVLQNGHLQYACIEQSGSGGNLAELSQNAKGDRSDFGNNAWQNQFNDGGAGGRNSAYGEQLGDRSTIVQKQSGSGNMARAKQADDDYNVSYQDQDGKQNHAYSQQNAYADYSYQRQTGGGGGGAGDNNSSSVTQNSNFAHSTTVQEGQNNTVYVYQH